MFFPLVLFMLGSACFICMPIAHSASFHAYEQASSEKLDDPTSKKNRAGFLGSAAWFQAVCYFSGICGALLFVWCGLELAAKLA
jgi:hypothetical protein